MAGIWTAAVLVWLGAAGSGAGLTGLSVDAGKLSPEFSPGRTAYTVRVGQGVGTINVTAAAEPDVTVTVNGAAPAPVPLRSGRTLIPVEVSGTDGSKTYTLKVLRDYPTPAWIKESEEASWAPRDSAGELVFRDRMWLLGGYIPEVVGDVWSSTDGRTWEHVGDVPDASGVNIPVNVVHDGKMWVTSNNGNLYASADGRDWALVTDRAPWRGRYASGSAAFKGRMWVLGGMRSGTLFNDVWSSADGVDWSLETEHAPWSRRQLFGLTQVFDGKLWVLGGGVTNYHPFKAYNDVWCSQDGREWTRVLDQAPWPGRIWSTSVVYRNRLWVLGGFQSEPEWKNLDDVWYSADGREWHELKSDISWSPRHELSACVFDNKLWVVAGNEWPLKNDVWHLDIPGLAFLTQPVVEELVGTEYTYRARADFNESRGKVRYQLAEAPPWLAVDAETGVLRGTPETAGDYAVRLEAYDDSGETARQAYTLHVVPMGG